MLHSDYLMRMLMDFANGIVNAMHKRREKRDPNGAAELLEETVSNALDMDGAALLALSPETIVSIMQVGGTDPALSEYIARSIMLASIYYAKAGNSEMAALRADQANAVADAYGHDISDMLDEDASPETDPEKAEEIAETAMQQFLEHTP